MLEDSALADFLKLVERATGHQLRLSAEDPVSALRTTTAGRDSLYRSDLVQLWRSAQIAHAAGDAALLPAQVVFSIFQQFRNEHDNCLSLRHGDPWIRAILWALDPDRLTAARISTEIAGSREAFVGAACARIRKLGYDAPINAHGVALSSSAQKDIADHVDAAISRVGGRWILRHLFKRLVVSRRLYGGLWLFGDRVTSSDQTAKPATPIGWLLPLAIRHIHRKPMSRTMDQDLREAVSLAEDLACCFDCQRYGMFEGFNPDAVEFPRVLHESVAWRELFSVPQMPPSTLPTLREAFASVEWPQDASELRNSVVGLLDELMRLVADLPTDELQERAVHFVAEEFPLLWRHSHAVPASANADYLGPFRERTRTHETFVFFETLNGAVVTLPRSITVACGVRMVFELLYEGQLDKPSELIARVYEESIAIACQGKCDHLYKNRLYHADRKSLEIDIATRTGTHIFLFETKAKILTDAARSGSLPSMIFDYANSYLALLKQLLRHEWYLKQGKTPIVSPDEALGKITITKVAVSPLSFGPIADKVLATALTEAISLNRLSLGTAKAKDAKLLGDFNALVSDVADELSRLAKSQKNGQSRLPYLMNVVWLDLGQVLYLLRRSSSLNAQNVVLSSTSFMTRDFWTEVAWADRLEQQSKTQVENAGDS